MNNEEQSYRGLLQELSVKSQEQYDKTVITLSTGALGLSFVFIKDVVDVKVASNINFLTGAWICFALSVLSVLLSFLASKYALDRAIVAEDNNEEIGIDRADSITTILNWLSAAFFIVGLVFMIVFVKLNLGDNL
ncbi:MAG: hypothetical protein COA39_011575 [Sulfurimonas sp.]|nr:hypothetical protein [Sulfurimonas sp.]